MDQSYDPSQRRLGYQLRRICDEVARSSNQDAAKLGLTYAQGVILLFLQERGGSSTQREVEYHLEVSHPAVSGILGRMEEKGLVRCAFDAQDRRVKNVYLTPEGAGYYDQVLALRRKADRLLDHSLTPAQLQTLQALLDQVYDNLFLGDL